MIHQCWDYQRRRASCSRSDHPPVSYGAPILTFGLLFVLVLLPALFVVWQLLCRKATENLRRRSSGHRLLISLAFNSSVSVQYEQSTSQGGRCRTPTLIVDLLQSKSLLHQPRHEGLLLIELAPLLMQAGLMISCRPAFSAWRENSGCGCRPAWCRTPRPGHRQMSRKTRWWPPGLRIVAE
jgi:hypothetical protein